MPIVVGPSVGAKIRFMYDNYVDLSTTTITASTEASGFPASNVSHIWHTRAWRTTALAAQWIQFDFGAAKNINTLIIKYANFSKDAVTPTTVWLQGHTSDDWAAPTFNENITSYIHDDITIYFLPTTQNLRYWRVRPDSPLNTDGYIRIGRIFLGTYFEPYWNFHHPIVKRLIDPSIKRYSTGGQVSICERKKYIQIPYNFPWIRRTDISSFETIWDAVGQSTPYFICETPDSDPYLTTYYVINSNPWDLETLYLQGKLLVNVETMR